MNVKRQHFTVITTPQPWNWVKLQKHVNNSKSSKFFAKSGSEMLNWVIGTQTNMDLNMMFAHTANYWA